MSNSKKDTDLIVSKIEELACYNNPGPTAVKAVEFINETYLLIPREELPQVTYGTLEDAFDGNSAKARIIKGDHTALTEGVFGGNTKKMREIAFQYLAMADHVDGKKKREEEKELNNLRAEAWNTIHPGSMLTGSTFHWQGCDPTERAAIEEIVKLKRQLAKALQKK